MDSLPGKGGDLVIPAIEEDEEEEEEIVEDDVFVEGHDGLSPRLVIPSSFDATPGAASGVDTEPVSPLSPLPPPHEDFFNTSSGGGVGLPLTAHALSMMQEEENDDRHLKAGESKGAS